MLATAAAVTFSVAALSSSGEAHNMMEFVCASSVSGDGEDLSYVTPIRRYRHGYQEVLPLESQVYQVRFR
ncbi:hypothetical protein EJB05_30507 [Eragrostis curvula]|uniref:Uncharacterized protein n=1 Tax=Eragrostis curvula TaxID=38414 RepID=A0A5J9UB56_9POAL|nr:hypothetical protein EJB05_30507 [Eragrostis curvula]